MKRKMTNKEEMKMDPKHLFDAIVHLSQDEFIEAFLNTALSDPPARYPSKDAAALVPSFDLTRESAYEYVSEHTNERMLIIVS